MAKYKIKKISMSVAVFAGVIASFYINYLLEGTNGNLTYFNFVNSRLTHIQELILDNKFSPKDNLFLGDSFSLTGLKPEMLDQHNQKKTWKNTYNLALPGQSLKLNIELIKWIIARKPEALKNTNVIWQLSISQFDISQKKNDPLVEALSNSNKYNFYPDSLHKDIINSHFNKVLNLGRNYKLTDLVYDISKIDTNLKFDWIRAVYIGLTELWADQLLLEPSWDNEKRGEIDFNYKNNQYKLKKIFSVMDNPLVQLSYKIRWNSYICNSEIKKNYSRLLEFKQLMSDMQKYSDHITIIISPVSGEIFKNQKCDSEINLFLKKLENDHINIINFSQALSNDNFYDYLHLNQNGIANWTEILRRDLSIYLK
jgi:hypothetical protein